MIKTVKLMACQECGDVVRLVRPVRWCRCRSSVGRQPATKRVLVAGPAVVFGLNAHDFDRALFSKDDSRVFRWYLVPTEDGVERTDVASFEGSD